MFLLGMKNVLYLNNDEIVVLSLRQKTLLWWARIFIGVLGQGQEGRLDSGFILKVESRDCQAGQMEGEKEIEGKH